jgi:hypothetical protein
MKTLFRVLKIVAAVIVGCLIVALGWVSVLAFVLVSPAVLACVIGVWIFKQAIR